MVIAKDLIKELKTYPRIINIKGSEDVFINEAIQVLIRFYIKKGTEDFNVSFIENESDKEIRTLLHEAPFDNDYKLVFLKGKKSVSIPRSTIVVSLDNSFKAPHLTIDCSKVYGRKLKSIIRQRAKSEGLNLDKEDLDVFIGANGSDLTTLFNEITKLSLLEEVSFKAINTLSQSNSNNRLDYLFKALASKNVQESLSAYYSLIHNNATNSSIYGFLVYAFKEVINAEKDDEENKYSRYKPLFQEEFLDNLFMLFYNLEDYIKDDTFPFYLLLHAISKRDFTHIQNFKILTNINSYNIMQI